VASATIEQLVFLLAGEAVPDKNFIAQVIRTHYRFVHSEDLFNKLIARYHMVPSQNNLTPEEFAKKKQIIQVRVINVIKKWIELQISDFQNDTQLFVALQKFVQYLLQSGGTEALWGSNLQVALVQAEQEQYNSSVVVSSEEPPKPILPKNMIARLMQFLDIDPLELARQMTLIESDSLCKILPQEYMHKCWCGPKKDTLAPNVLAIIQRFNQTSYWVASEVVRQGDPQLRAKYLSRFVKLIKHLKELKNFQSLMAVYSALNMSAILRLQETWKLLSSKHASILKEVGELMSSTQNYRNYREYLRNTYPPLIPFQGIYLSDLTFMEEAPDFLENGAINFHKMGLVGGVFNEIYKFQTVKHPLFPVDCIQEYILNFGSAVIYDDVQLYDISKKIEPRKEI